MNKIAKQLDFNNLTIQEKSIERLRLYEPPEGYYLAFSGGKDSIVIYDLAVKAGVKFDAHYNITCADPPELVQFIKKQYPDVKRHIPPVSLWKLIAKNGLPIRQRRWCCRELKERGGEGRFVVTGVRWNESSRRAQRNMIESCYHGRGKRYLNVIIDWSTPEVWEYIHENKIPYCSLYDEGFKRLGCILCPMNSRRIEESKRWPKIADAWKRAAIKYYNSRLPEKKTFSSGEEFFEWWLSGKSKKVKSQSVLFE